MTDIARLRALLAGGTPGDSTTLIEAANALPALLDEVERLRGLLGRLVSLGWLMDSLPDDELAHDLYNYDRAALSPEPKRCPSCSTKHQTEPCSCATDCGLWDGCMAATADRAFAQHSPEPKP